MFAGRPELQSQKSNGGVTELPIDVGLLSRSLEADTRSVSWASRVFHEMQKQADDVSRLSVRCLIAVMHAQHRTCPVTGVKFELSHERTNLSESVPAWVGKMDNVTRCRYPKPIRPNRRKPYSTDNLVFVSEPVAVIYGGMENPGALIPWVANARGFTRAAVIAEYLKSYR